MSALDFARRFHAVGWCPLPIPPRTKSPALPQWQKLRLREDELARHFSGPCNVGINLGEASGGLADVDLDCPEAVLLAPSLLPATLTFGRDSKQVSHWLYRSPGSITSQYRDPADGATLVELRATPASAVGQNLGGSQTVFPPSQHPSGEWVRFTSGWQGLPLELASSELLARVVALAVASLVARHANLDAARAFGSGGPLPVLEPVVRGRVLEWLGVRAPLLPTRSRSWKLQFNSGPRWIEELRHTHPAEVALGLGREAVREKGISQCPACGAEVRSSHDRGIPVGFTTSRDGTVLWHHGKCGTHGNSVQLASLLLLGKLRPSGREDWLRLKSLLTNRGVIRHG